MPSHSLNPELYPDGHGVVTDQPTGARHNSRPVPQANHLASIERDANVKAAIEFAMASQDLPYPAAAKLVHEKGEKFWLDQRNAISNEIHANQNRPLTVDELRPDGVSDDTNPILSQREAAVVGRDNFMGNPAYPTDAAQVEATARAANAPANANRALDPRGQNATPLRPGEQVVDVAAKRVNPAKPTVVASGKK